MWRLNINSNNNNKVNLYSAGIRHVVALMALLHIKHHNAITANKAKFLDPINK